MVLRTSTKFTPERLLSLPRPSAGVPNPSGTLFVNTVSTYSFIDHKKTTEVNLVQVIKNSSITIAKDEKVSSFNWLDDDRLIYFRADDDGKTQICVANIGQAQPKVSLKDVEHIAGQIDASADNLKIAPLRNERHAFAIVFSALTSPDGSLYTTSKASRKTHSSGKLYDRLFVRHWDTYDTREKNSLWYGKLTRAESGKYQTSNFRNALKHLKNVECPIKPFGGVDHFDVSHDSIVLVAKDPELDPALNTKCAAYVLRFTSMTQENAPAAERLEFPDIEGAMTSPVFDKSGSKIALLAMQTAGYEADRNRIALILDVSNSKTSREQQDSSSGQAPLLNLDHWDHSPQSLVFSANGKHLLTIAEDKGRSRAFAIAIDSVDTKIEPVALTSTESVSHISVLQDGRIYLHGSSLVDNAWDAIMDFQTRLSSPLLTWSDSHSVNGAKFGLKPSQVSWIWTPASNTKINKEVHSLVMRPSWYSANDVKKFPVAYLIHGGPQGAWNDSWSTRWNPAIFAEQGYIVIAPNPTGSTGYGQSFTDAIRENWGGDPYQDIVSVFRWVDENMPQADNDRAVALGASYGGYMMNWIQGHDLGRKFKALVCHDGNFSLSGTMLATEELYFPFHEMGGLPWSRKDVESKTAPSHPFAAASLSNWQKWDPSRFADQWQTPQLIIHSEKDYRLTISEGLAAFNVLQTRGVPSQFLTFPDENHWVLNPENSLVWHKVVLNWINKYAGLPAYTIEDPANEKFWGGYKVEEEGEEEEKS